MSKNSNHKVKPKKFLGQHFLKDDNIAHKIASIVKPYETDIVIEIGAGMGMMTKHLLNLCNNLQVIEIDHESVDYLQQHFPLLKNKIYNNDFLKLDLESLFHKQTIGIIGNFPYNISSQIVFNVLEYKSQIAFFGGMFQKEVAQRIAAKPNSKTYGILSVLCQAYYEVSYLFTVPPHVFNPPPKVDSGVIKLIRKTEFNLSVDEHLFKKIIRTAFNQRRKTLRNSLKSFNLPKDLTDNSIFAQRPEQLSYKEFINLTKMIAPFSHK